jgi:hypothetical protein
MIQLAEHVDEPEDDESEAWRLRDRIYSQLKGCSVWVIVLTLTGLLSEFISLVPRDRRKAVIDLVSNTLNEVVDK